MKTFIALFIVLFFSFASTKISSQQVWLNSYNGPSNGNDGSNAITVDAEGNTYIAGYTTGTGTGKDITVIKYDPNGIFLWSKIYNGSGNGADVAYAITVDRAGNVYITGESAGIASGPDVITLKYASNGRFIWEQRYTGPGSYQDVAYAITVDSKGDIIVSGYTSSADESQMLTIKYSSSGEQLWVDTQDVNAGEAGEVSSDVAYAITVDRFDNVIVTGFSMRGQTDATGGGKDIVTVKFTSGGTSQWVKIFNGTGNSDDESHSIVSDESGSVFITGYSTNSDHNKDYITIKYSSSGAQQWAKTYNNSSANSDDIANKMIIDEDGSVYITGSSKSSAVGGSEDYLTIKYTSGGSQVFASRYNDASNNSDIAYSIAQYKRNKFYVVGSSQQSSSEGSEDIVLIEYKADGKVKSKHRINNPGTDAAYDVVADKDGSFMLAGFLCNSGDMTSTNSDMCAAKYSADGSANNDLILTNVNDNIPAKFQLYQNYPNPFNPTTNIKFDVQASSVVNIIIYDMLGSEVYRPVSEFLTAGTYDISLSLEKMSSGIYFYRMISGGFTESKSMILIK